MHNCYTQQDKGQNGKIGADFFMLRYELNEDKEINQSVFVYFDCFFISGSVKILPEYGIVFRCQTDRDKNLSEREILKSWESRSYTVVSMSFTRTHDNLLLSAQKIAYKILFEIEKVIRKIMLSANICFHVMS